MTSYEEVIAAMGKYPPGTRVHITPELPAYMSHFEKDRDATVLYTYAMVYGGQDPQNNKKYTLCVDGKGPSAWYDEHQLTVI
jgi:hypothetical protein